MSELNVEAPGMMERMTFQLIADADAQSQVIVKSMASLIAE